MKLIYVISIFLFLFALHGQITDAIIISTNNNCNIQDYTVVEKVTEIGNKNAEISGYAKFNIKESEEIRPYLESYVWKFLYATYNKEN